MVTTVGCASAPPPAPTIRRATPVTALPVLPAPTDRDGDLIADVDDRCPDEPEDFDDHDDGDGCPDHGLRPSDEPVAEDSPAADATSELPRVIAFAPRASRPTGDVRAIVDRALALGRDARVLLVGHSDRTESNDPALSLVRAHVVAAMLVSRGIDPSRVVALGVGAWCLAPWRPPRAVEVAVLREGELPGVCPAALAHLRATGGLR